MKLPNLLINTFLFLSVFIMSFTPGLSQSCQLATLDSLEAAALPEITLNVNIHFVGSPNGNFTVGEPDDSSDTLNGNWTGRELLRLANEIWKNPIENPTGLRDFLYDTKFRYKLYTDTTNTNDSLGGIFFWDSLGQMTKYYGDTVLNIIFYDRDTTECSTGCCVAGADDPSATGEVVLYDAYVTTKNPNCDFDIFTFAGTLNHEVAHDFGLKHSFDCSNDCPDLDPIAECDGTATCDSCNLGEPETPNFMSYGFPQEAISPCQWNKMYSLALLSPETLGYVKRDCELEGAPNEIVISNGQYVVWDSLKYILSNVKVKTGATLSIKSCNIYFASNKRIEVERGALLYVENANLNSICPENWWAGIYVHGNSEKEQPAADPPFSNLDSIKAGIVHLDGASIQRARTAICTAAPSVSWPAHPNYWGGLIYAELTTFLDNRRSVEFMKYPYSDSIPFLGFKNKSLFKGCQFIDSTIEKSEKTVGVTIWDTDSIVFENCWFKYFDLEGIRAYDSEPILTEDNLFKENRVGISSYATYPFSSELTIGDDDLDLNYFIDNFMHVDVYGASNRAGIVITNNSFQGDGDPPIGQISMGIAIEGPTKYRIFDNGEISGSDIGIFSLNTNRIIIPRNEIICNDIEGDNWGIYVSRDNKNLRIRDNDINGLGSLLKSDMIITGETKNPGSVFEFQGNVNNSAGNCFEHQDEDIYTLGTTTSFLYYADTSANTCETPTRTGNYELIESFRSSQGCAENGSPNGEPPYDEDDLNTQDSIILDLKDSLEVYPDSIELKLDLYSALDEKENILMHLIEDNIENGDYDVAEDIVGDQEEFQYRLVEFGLLVNRGAYDKADNLLNNFPDSTQDLSWFKQVQEINIDRLKSDTVFVLTTTQDSILNKVATSKSQMRGYARSMLSFLKDSVYIHDFTLPEEPSKPVVTQIESHRNQPLVKVYPNPTRQTLFISIDFHGEKHQAKVYIYDILGRLVYENRSISAALTKIDTHYFRPGLYSILVFVEDRILFNSKVVVVK